MNKGPGRNQKSLIRKLILRGMVVIPPYTYFTHNCTILMGLTYAHPISLCVITRVSFGGGGGREGGHLSPLGS